MKTHKDKGRYFIAIGIISFPGNISPDLKRLALDCIDAYRGDEIVDPIFEGKLRDALIDPQCVLPF